jgi:hypothetical protein
MNSVGKTRAGEKLYLPSQKRSESEVTALIASVSSIPGIDHLLGQSAADCSIEYYNGPMSDDREFVVAGRVQIWIEIHGRLLTGEPDFVADVLANYEHGGVEAVDAFLESIDCFDYVPRDYSKVEIAHLDCSLDTTEIDAEVVYQDLSESEVIELIDDVLDYDGSNIRSLSHGDEDGVIHIVKGYDVASNLSVSETTPLQVEFCGEPLKAMSVSDLGNFLYSLKHHGQDVAFATLNRIYSKA